MFLCEDGRLRIEGPDGKARFDSDEDLFHVVTNNITGTLTIPPLTYEGGVHQSVTPYYLGACHPACTHAIGALKFTLFSAGAGMAYDRWTTIMGGSVVWLMDSYGGLQDGRRSPACCQIVYYTLRVASGSIYLDRVASLGRMPNNTFYTVIGHSIHYRLKAGLFT